MEKIKDLIHDFTDILLALVIVVAMFGVIAFNLGDWFSIGSNVSAAETSTVNIPITPIEIVDNGENSEDEDIGTDEEATEDKEEENQQPSESNPEPSPITVVDDIQYKEITIPNGTPGVGVAKILHDHGLIENVNEFIRTAESLNLALRLQSGTFRIPKNASLEDIVRIIAKVNR